MKASPKKYGIEYKKTFISKAFTDWTSNNVHIKARMMWNTIHISFKDKKNKYKNKQIAFLMPDH